MWWRREKKEVAEFLYGLLVADSPKGYARDVAERMQVPYPTLSKYWLGKRRFPAALVSPLFLATNQDPRVAEFFLLRGSDYRLERAGAEQPPADLARAVVELGELAGRVAGLYLQSSDGQADDATSAPNIIRQLRATTQDLIAHAHAIQAAYHE